MPWKIERVADSVVAVEMTTNRANVQGPPFFGDLHGAFDILERDFSDCAVVLTGNSKVFSAGLDFDYHFPLFAKGSTADVDAWFAEYRATNLRVFTYPRPTIAAISGHAYAGGLITALNCDCRIAVRGSSSFALNEVPIGIPMPAVYIEIIKYAIGSKAAAEMSLFGKIYDLEAATALGVVHEVVSRTDLLPRAINWAQQVGPNCFEAYGFTKRALQASTLRAIDHAARLDTDGLARGMTCVGSRQAHADKYRELKGTEPFWLSEADA